MLDDYLKTGDKVELEVIRSADSDDAMNLPKKKTYVTEMYDVLSEDRFEVLMPMEQTKLILLPVDSEYNMCFVSEGGQLYQCCARIIDRYKSNNVYILAMEMTSNLRKYQRREYYRFSCALDMDSRNLVEEELDAIEKKRDYLLPGLPLRHSVIVDISGGGIRFISKAKYSEGSLIYCRFHLQQGGEWFEYHVIGEILMSKELENREGEIEHRLQFINMDNDDREIIIRYIFDEERKYRKRIKGQ